VTVDSSIRDFLSIFGSILWEAMPFIVLGALIAGVLEEFLPQEWITRILPRPLLPSIVIGSLLGMVFPMCECGIVVIMRRLLRKGLPLSAAIAYMLAGPILNVVVIGSTWMAFEGHNIAPEVVGLRMGGGFLVACLTALIVHVQYKKYGNSLLTPMAMPRTAAVQSQTPVASRPVKMDKMLFEDKSAVAVKTAAPIEVEQPQIRKTVLDRLGNISGTALHDFVDITVFLILGAVLAAVARLQIGTETINQYSQDQPLLAIPAMMFLAILICLCSEADAFVAASFTGMHISAKIAFLVLGPMLDLKLLMMFSRVFKPRLIATIVVSTFTLVLIFALGIHAFYSANHWTGLAGPVSSQPVP
jgi:uncharacterized membrane protein YraQ (UPF0718 family)